MTEHIIDSELLADILYEYSNAKYAESVADDGQAGVRTNE